MEKEMLAIVVLNWNNAPDTLECVESLLEATREINAAIFITDNGSDDDSVNRITGWLEKRKIVFSHFNAILAKWIRPVSGDKMTGVCLLEHGENLGFSKGNNEAIRFILRLFPGQFDRLLLLNNDTLVPEKSLVRLLDSARKFLDFKVWTPVICYADERDKVWNAGGFLRWWGERKYIGHKKLLNLLPNMGIQQISFITGCALMMNMSLPESGIFLNEDFFFGEEDYYFSKQMKVLHVNMAVTFDSVIYHKVSTSIKQISPKTQMPLYFIHYLNRIVDMKKWMHPIVYILWKPGFILHAGFNVWWKRWYSVTRMFKFTVKLWKSSKKTKITKEDFFHAHKLF